MVLLTRLAIVFPYGPLNYSFGLSGVRFRDYLIGTNIGTIPPILFVIYLGATAGKVTALLGESLQPERQTFLLHPPALAIVALVGSVTARSAVNVLREELPARQKPEVRAPEAEA